MQKRLNSFVLRLDLVTGCALGHNSLFALELFYDLFMQNMPPGGLQVRDFINPIGRVCLAMKVNICVSVWQGQQQIIR